MIRAWRLSPFAEASRVFDGEGARRYAGRWNPAGVPVVYTSESLALAALELPVHVEIHQLARPLYAHRVDLPANLVARPAASELPRGWDELDDPSPSQAFGGAWARSGRSLALAVPSIVVRSETNYVLAVEHAGFGRLKVEPAGRFSFDPRLSSRR